jgi:uncharacterized membrane protein YvbJ
VKCSYCGKPNSDDARFCQECGKALIAATKAASAAPASDQCPICGRPGHFECETCGRPMCRYHVLSTEVPERYSTGYSIGNVPIYEAGSSTHYRCHACAKRRLIVWSIVIFAVVLLFFGLAMMWSSPSETWCKVLPTLLGLSVWSVATYLEYFRWKPIQ